MRRVCVLVSGLCAGGADDEEDENPPAVIGLRSAMNLSLLLCAARLQHQQDV